MKLEKVKKLGKTRAGIMVATLSVIPALALSSYILSPFQVEAASDSDICVTATRVDAPTIISKRGWCPEDIVTPAPTATPTGTPVSTAEPTATPTPSPTPTTGVSSGQVFVNTVGTSTITMRKIAPLNDGGTIIAKSDGIWFTQKLGVEPRKLVGMAITSPVGVEASGDGQTIALYSDRYIQVSWDGGSTWMPLKEQQYYSIDYIIKDAAVAESGASVMTVSHRGDPNSTGITMGTTKATKTWNYNDKNYGYKPFVSKDGGSARQPVFGSEYIRTISVSSQSGGNAPTLYTYNFGAFATNGSLSSQLTVMDSYQGDAAFNVMALRISRDGGKTWVIAKKGAFTNLQVSSDGQTMFAVDSSYKMHLSKDNGATWNIVDPIGNGVLISLAELAHDAKSIIITGRDGKLYQTSVP